MNRARQRRNRAGVTLLETLVVLAIIGIVAGLTFPGITSGLDALRLRSAADSVAGLLAQAAVAVERRQQPVELTIEAGGRRVEFREGMTGVVRELELPQEITISRVLPEPPGAPDGPRVFILVPGGTLPGLAVEIAGPKGRRRVVRIDPVTSTPQVEDAGLPAPEEK